VPDVSSGTAFPSLQICSSKTFARKIRLKNLFFTRWGKLHFLKQKKNRIRGGRWWL